MRITITDRLVSRTAQEGSSVPFAVKVYDDSVEPWTLTVPTSLRYRVDNPVTGRIALDWTAATPDDESSITITQTTLSDCYQMERLQLVVEANHGLSTACVAKRDFWVDGLVGVT